MRPLESVPSERETPKRVFIAFRRCPYWTEALTSSGKGTLVVPPTVTLACPDFMVGYDEGAVRVNPGRDEQTSRVPSKQRPKTHHNGHSCQDGGQEYAQPVPTSSKDGLCGHIDHRNVVLWNAAWPALLYAF